MHKDSITISLETSYNASNGFHALPSSPSHHPHLTGSSYFLSYKRMSSKLSTSCSPSLRYPNCSLKNGGTSTMPVGAGYRITRWECTLFLLVLLRSSTRHTLSDFTSMMCVGSTQFEQSLCLQRFILHIMASLPTLKLAECSWVRMICVLLQFGSHLPIILNRVSINSLRPPL